MFQKLHTKELLKQLENINVQLEKYPNVNDTILEHFSRVTELKEKSSKRLKELDEG